MLEKCVRWYWKNLSLQFPDFHKSWHVVCPGWLTALGRWLSPPAWCLCIKESVLRLGGLDCTCGKPVVIPWGQGCLGQQWGAAYSCPRHCIGSVQWWCGLQPAYTAETSPLGPCLGAVAKQSGSSPRPPSASSPGTAQWSASAGRCSNAPLLYGGSLLSDPMVAEDLFPEDDSSDLTYGNIIF